MKSIKRIEDFETFTELYRSINKYCYYGYKPITEEKRKALEKKDNIENFKEKALYMLEDGYFFFVNNKDRIENEIYYDDEYDAPEINEENFIHYNMSNLTFNFDDWKKELHDLKTIGCCSGRVELKPFINLNRFGNCKEVYPVFYTYCGNTRKNESTVRDLTEDEVNDILEIAEKHKEEYIERLKKYFKRYRKNIYTHGYWANR